MDAPTVNPKKLCVLINVLKKNNPFLSRQELLSIIFLCTIDIQVPERCTVEDREVLLEKYGAPYISNLIAHNYLVGCDRDDTIENNDPASEFFRFIDPVKEADFARSCHEKAQREQCLYLLLALMIVLAGIYMFV
jgi:hypothetical protein